MPHYEDIPAALLGRLARDESFRGRGLGQILLSDALTRAFKASLAIGINVVATHPKNPLAERFYATFGFEWSTSELMYLSMKKVKTLHSL